MRLKGENVTKKKLFEKTVKLFLYYFKISARYFRFF